MKLEDFDYHLPPELVAQYPARRRTDARMLVGRRKEKRLEDATFRQLPNFLEPGDLLAFNNSRVLPARLFGYRMGVYSQPIGKRNPAQHEYLHSQIEVLLARKLDQRTWEALVKPGRKVRVGEKLVFHGHATATFNPGKEQSPLLQAEVIGRGDFGLRILRFPEGISLPEMLERVGHVPLPPYIHRPDEKQDRLRYQTVYARQPGSVAAPTAGLHFTKEILYKLEKRGVERVEITLHVGLGTFQPIHALKIEEHRMHPERFDVAPEAAARLNRALEQKRRIVAVGTTTVRTLEHIAAAHGGRIEPGSGETQLFILPEFPFRVVGGLLTNFHLPRTTLLMLVCAFAGRELTLAAYEHAVRERYRFYSYGDCMLIL
ncbi:MAG: tRNA preQ1(34) S-adenosylmethionine ribosyltransferase-isomerase QueA [Acidobacteria bacterium]|nr:tRNA preQ1(34) S-adenosylmethionine ribosyltransferase-isomerase QueA [Acidobacteriota bacterium]